MTEPSDTTRIDRFDDIFHQYGDYLDEENDKYIDFDNYITNTDNDNVVDDDTFYIDIMKVGQFNENENIVTNVKIQEQEEEHLSQKLSQLSASGQIQIQHVSEMTTTTTKKRPSLTPTTETTALSMTKKLKTNEDIKSIEWISNYLSSSNGKFDEMLRPLLNMK